ncbi:hypothetical protein [Marinobacterium lacunae]|uniref:hypothetical protein n=1 Tax=Marinobacterium lacunae TaxID=1232683 RepID=UPI000569C554|nr:hypothetical protein [Marinobacterium lacunae]
MGKIRVREPLIVFFILLLAGCGEAQFYKHLQYENKSVKAENVSNEIIEETANELGYNHCDDGIGYCKGQVYYFSIKQVSTQGFELVFFHSFGGYPGPENKNVSDFASALGSKCGACVIKEKESSSWGFHDEETDWVQVHP